MHVVVGVDPGGHETGIVVRRGSAVAGGCVIARQPQDSDASYIAAILEAVDGYLADSNTTLVAVEGIVHPNPHVRMTNVDGLLDASKVFGAVVGRWPDAAIVDPAGNGSGPLASYPAELVGERETTGSGGWRRHLRSAWDVAGAAQHRLRIGAGSAVTVGSNLPAASFRRPHQGATRVPASR